MDDQLRKKLASYVHELWARWTSSLLSRCDVIYPGDKGLIVPRIVEQRWRHLIGTKYDDLPPEEKKRDLEVADELLRLLEGWRFGQDALHVVHKAGEASKDVDISFAHCMEPSIVWQSMEHLAKITSMPADNVNSWTEVTVQMTAEEREAFEQVIRELDGERPILELESIDTRWIPGRGTIKTVRCDAQLLPRASKLSGSSLVIDGQNWFVTNVECFIPIRIGDTLGLVVRKPEDDERVFLCGTHGWVRFTMEDEGGLGCGLCSARYRVIEEDE